MNLRGHKDIVRGIKVNPNGRIVNYLFLVFFIIIFPSNKNFYIKILSIGNYN